MAGKDGDGIPRERKEPRPDFTKPLPRTKLPASIQATLDDEEKMWEVLDDKQTQSTDTSLRYAAYASRFRTILLSAHRYVAYTSDVGESFRPIAHPGMIRAAYGISWLYLAGDVSYEGYKAYYRNQAVRHPHLKTDAKDGSHGDPRASDGTLSLPIMPGKVAAIDDYRTVMAQRAIFQSVASMGLPAFTIHSVVRYSGQALKNAKNKTVRTWGPIGLGLAVVPFLPYLFDKPVEHAVEWAFHKGFETFGGSKAVDSTRPALGVPAKIKDTKKEL